MIGLIVAICSTLLGMLATLMMLVLLMAGGANSSPQQITFIKFSMLAMLLICLISVVGAVWLMVARHPWWAAMAGAIPAFAAIALTITWHVSEQARLNREAKNHPWNQTTKQVSDK